MHQMQGTILAILQYIKKNTVSSIKVHDTKYLCKICILETLSLVIEKQNHLKNSYADKILLL